MQSVRANSHAWLTCTLSVSKDNSLCKLFAIKGLGDAVGAILQ